jgi:hypothetical protein
MSVPVVLRPEASTDAEEARDHLASHRSDPFSCWRGWIWSDQSKRSSWPHVVPIRSRPGLEVQAP